MLLMSHRLLNSIDYRVLVRGAHVAATILVVLFALWLAADQEIVALPGEHDDLWFIKTAKYTCWFGDEPYSHMSFIKEPIYPLFIALCYRLGMPLRLATQAAFLIAAWFFASVVARRSSPWVGLTVFTVCALHPLSHVTFARATADGLYSILLLASLAALLQQYQGRSESGGLWRGLLSGVLLGLLWNTRPERPLVLALLVFFVLVALANDWRRGASWWTLIRTSLSTWFPPVAVVASITLLLMAANKLRWGVFATTALSAPGFTAAYRAILSAEPRESQRFVPVPQDARMALYEASPSFRKLAPFLEDGTENSWMDHSRKVYKMIKGHEIGAGYLVWAVRDSAAQTGECQSGPASESFFFRIAQEVEDAARDGRLKTRFVPPYSFDPCLSNYLEHLPASFAVVWLACWSEIPESADVQETPGEHVKTFEEVACRRALSAEPRFQALVRSWIVSRYTASMTRLLVIAGLVAFVVLVLRSRVTGSGMYLLVGTALALAGVSRLALFALVDASSFQGSDRQYLFPAALALSVMAAWLLAEGVRLLLPRSRQVCHGSLEEVGGQQH